MITLLIDTSSSDVSIAILKDHKLLESITNNIPNQHSIYTVDYINQVLQKVKIKPQEVNRIMVVTGPGSFTGLRIGVTIAKVFAYITNIKIIPISSLKMRAISTNHENCLSIIDAHHDRYYIGLYDKNNKEIIEEKLETLEEVIDIINKYHPLIVSDLDGTINKTTYKKQKLDLEKIEEYYDNHRELTPHLVNPNYLKKPQVLEEKND